MTATSWYEVTALRRLGGSRSTDHVTDNLRYEVTADGVGRIILDPPEAKNDSRIEMRDAIVDAVAEARADDEVAPSS